MVSAAGLTSLLLGATLSHTAGRGRAHGEVLETISGALLVAGLALLGSALPVVF